MAKNISPLIWVNLTMRWILEAGIVFGFAFWGYHTGEKKSTKLLLSIIAPLVGFGFWGLIDFHQFGRFAEWLRLTQELLISALASAALYVVGAHILGYTLMLLSIIYHIAVYLLGERLLKRVHADNVET
jgi:hypothetical protein